MPTPRRDRSFSSLAHPPRLPEVTPLVRCDDVQTCGKTEANAADERVREVHAGQVGVRVAAQECADLVLRGEELPGRIAERRRRARLNAFVAPSS